MPEQERPRLVALRHEFGGLDPVSGAFTKFRDMEAGQETIPVHEYLDCLTAIVERGMVDRSSFVHDLFETPEDCETLAQLIEHYDEFWVNERHLHAFMRLTRTTEADCTTYSRIAEAFVNAMQRQLDQQRSR